jgi:hypothetical protein
MQINIKHTTKSFRFSFCFFETMTACFSWQPRPARNEERYNILSRARQPRVDLTDQTMIELQLFPSLYK